MFREELREYGYRFSVSRSIMVFLLLMGAMVALGRAFYLTAVNQTLLCGFALVMLPFFIRNTWKNRYEQKCFSDINIYMEQFLYSFQKSGKVLTSLGEVKELFEKGKMNEVITKAEDYINHTYTEQDVERKGLLIIEEAYPYDGLTTIHRFALEVEKSGGEFHRSILLLLEARRMWEDRTIELLKEKQKQHIRVIMSIFTSLLLCLMIYFVGGEMNVEVASESIAQTVTLLVLMSDMVIFYRSSKRLTADVINEDPGKTAELVAQYKRFMKYDDRKLFDRVAKRASMKSLSRAIEAEFPKWLMEVSLLLQTENVQVSIFRSYVDAPKLLQPALKELIYQLRKHPTELMPYVNFLAEFGLSDVRSAMKMLYSLSEGTGGDAERQIEDIIRRNQEMFDRAEKIRNEDKLSGMYALFLAPQVTGGLKLIVDMMLLLTIYLSQMGRVSI